MSHNNVGPAGAESLATALKANTTLTNLVLISSELGPAGAESFAIALKTNTGAPNENIVQNHLNIAS